MLGEFFLYRYKNQSLRASLRLYDMVNQPRRHLRKIERVREGERRLGKIVNEKKIWVTVKWKDRCGYRWFYSLTDLPRHLQLSTITINHLCETCLNIFSVPYTTRDSVPVCKNERFSVLNMRILFFCCFVYSTNHILFRWKLFNICKTFKKYM